MSSFLPFNLSNYFNSNPTARAARAARAANKAEIARIRQLFKLEQQKRIAQDDDDDAELLQAIERAGAAIQKTFGPYEV